MIMIRMILQTSNVSALSQHSHAIQYRHTTHFTHPLSYHVVHPYITHLHDGESPFSDIGRAGFCMPIREWNTHNSHQLKCIVSIIFTHITLQQRVRYWSPFSDVGCGIACRIEHAYRSPRGRKQQPLIEMARCNQQPSIEMTR